LKQKKIQPQHTHSLLYLPYYYPQLVVHRLATVRGKVGKICQTDIIFLLVLVKQKADYDSFDDSLDIMPLIL